MNKKTFISVWLLFCCLVLTLKGQEQTITLQPGSEGKDACIFGKDNGDRASYADSHFLLNFSWTFQSIPGDYRTLIDWDLSAIPIDAIIISAKLSLYAHADYPHSTRSGANGLWIERIVQPWEEDQVNWDNQPITTHTNRVAIPASTSASQNFTNIDVLSLIRDIHTNRENSSGMMLKLQTEHYYRSMNFCSSDYSDASKRPKLEIIYEVSSKDKDGDGFDDTKDCDDTNPNVHPNAMEIPNNNIDENCDGVMEVTESEGYDVIWTDALNMDIYSNSLIKNTSDGWGNSGAISENLLKSGEDGWVEGRTEEGDTYKILGLSSTNNGFERSAVNYGIYLATDARVLIIENDKHIWKDNIPYNPFFSYVSNDIYRIERVGSQILYKRNGTTFYTSNTSSTGSLIAHVTAFTSGATISNVRASFPAPEQIEVDADKDGYPAIEDCDDNNPQIPAQTGTSCDDGNPKTYQDQILSDGCTCQGTTTCTPVNSLLPYSPTVCAGEEIQLTHASQGDSYEWTPSTGLNDPTIANPTATLTQSTTYTVKTFTEEECFTQTISVLVNAPPAVDVINNLSYCPDEKVQLYAKGIIKEDYRPEGLPSANAVDTFSYDWQPSTGLENPLTATPTASPDGITTYTVTATDYNNCTATARVTVVPEKPANCIPPFFIPDENSDVDIRFSGGKVIIGDTDLAKPGNYRLYVQDGILTERAVVAIPNTNAWADYVFEKDYSLLPLEDLEKFIAKHGHLPNIPSRKEIDKNGRQVDLGQLNIQLLEKIEELTLHLIDQDKQLKVLKKQNQQMREVLIKTKK